MAVFMKDVLSLGINLNLFYRNISPEDQISINFDTLRLCYKKQELDSMSKIQLAQSL